MTKIEVRLNPDTPPTGSDLSVVNAARRSFNTRSEWANEDDLWINPWVPVEPDGDLVRYEMLNPHVKPILKDKDKRLIEFLARGMTADDFEQFVNSVAEDGQEAVEQGASMCWQDLVEKLWQWRNTPTHDTPFNHAFISFEVKAPIFVRAQLVKHEYLIMSEFSRRYITDGIEFYEPEMWRSRPENKKQGSGPEFTTVTEEDTQYTKDAVGHYMYLLEIGVAPEQARMVLPQSAMTEWTWSGTLGAFAKMCQLRLHPEAQYEARLVAQEVYKHLKAQWPVSAPALVEGVL